MSHKKNKGGSSNGGNRKKSSSSHPKPKRSNSKQTKDDTKFISHHQRQLSPQDRVAFVKPFWESLEIADRVQLLTVDVNEIVSRIAKTLAGETGQSLDGVYQLGRNRLDSDGTWKVWSWSPSSPHFTDAESFRKESLEKIVPIELLPLLPREEGKPLEKPAEAALRDRMTALINTIHTQLQSAQEAWRKGQRAITNDTGGECTRDANIDLVITILDTLQHEHHCLYQMILIPVAEFVCSLLSTQTRKTTKSELFFEDLEKLTPEDVARLYEWLTEKVDGLCSRLKPDPKEEDPDEEAVGDIDLFSLTEDKSSFTVNPKWMEHLQDRKLSEEGQPRKVQKGEDEHRVGLVLEWVYGSIVSTAEKARDGAKRPLGDWKPSVHQAYENLLHALTDQSEWTQRSKDARALLRELLSIRKHMSGLTSEHGVCLPDTSESMETNEEIPDPVIEGLLQRESVLTDAKVSILNYDRMTATNQLRSLKTELNQVEPEFERLKKELETRGNARSTEKDRLRLKLNDAMLEDQIEVQSAFREQGVRLQGLYDKRQRTEMELARRNQEISQLENWKKNVNQLLRKFQSPTETNPLADSRRSFYKDFKKQLYSDLDDQTFFSRIKTELKQVEKRVEDGAVVLQHLEMFLINIACDDPGALIGTSVILPLLQERLEEKAMEYSTQRASEAMDDLLKMEEARKQVVAKKETKKKPKTPSSTDHTPRRTQEESIEDTKQVTPSEVAPSPVVREPKETKKLPLVENEEEFQNVSNRRRQDRRRNQGKRGMNMNFTLQKFPMSSTEKTMVQQQSFLDSTNKTKKRASTGNRTGVLLALRVKLATERKDEIASRKKQSSDWVKTQSMKEIAESKNTDNKTCKQSSAPVAWIKGTLPASVISRAPQNTEEATEKSKLYSNTNQSLSEISFHVPSTPDPTDGVKNPPSEKSDQNQQNQLASNEPQSTVMQSPKIPDSINPVQFEQCNQSEICVRNPTPTEPQDNSEDSFQCESTTSSLHSSDSSTPEPEHMMMGPPLMPPPMGIPPPISPAFHPNYFTQMQSVMNTPLPPPPPGYHPHMTGIDEESMETIYPDSRTTHTAMTPFHYYHHVSMPGYPMVVPYGQWFPPGMSCFGTMEHHGHQVKMFTLRPTAEEFVPPSLKQGDQIETIIEHHDDEESEDQILTSNDDDEEEEETFDNDYSTTEVLPEVKESAVSVTPIIKQTC
eukprot:g4496.t1